jgi:hypothetical protein
MRVRTKVFRNAFPSTDVDHEGYIFASLLGVAGCGLSPERLRALLAVD